jgi:hypothetical protein
MGRELPAPQSSVGTEPPLQVLGTPLYQGELPPAQGDAQPPRDGIAARAEARPKARETRLAIRFAMT